MTNEKMNKEILMKIAIIGIMQAEENVRSCIRAKKGYEKCIIYTFEEMDRSLEWLKSNKKAILAHINSYRYNEPTLKFNDIKAEREDLNEHYGKLVGHCYCYYANMSRNALNGDEQKWYRDQAQKYAREYQLMGE